MGDHCDARDAGNSKAPTNLEAQKAITQAQGNTTDRLRRGESASCQKKKTTKKPPNQTRGSSGRTIPKLVLKRHLMESERKDSNF